MHFRHNSAKIQLKNLKQHFDWGGGPGTPGYNLAPKWETTLSVFPKDTANKSHKIDLI